MRWEMEKEDIEAAMEKIWDLHDKVSDVIHSISRSHFLKSTRTVGKPSVPGQLRAFGGGGGGFVFVKGEEEGREEDGAMAEARSLDGIRTGLENLEEQLAFLTTVQSQQHAERDAAIAQLEQSRIILAMRLADHHGKKYKVIEEALAFVGDTKRAGNIVARRNLSCKARSHYGDNLVVHNSKIPNIFTRMVISGINLIKKSIKLGIAGGVVGNAALFAMSMLAVFQLHQVASKSGLILEAPSLQEQFRSKKRVGSYSSGLERNHNEEAKHLDVFSARG